MTAKSRLVAVRVVPDDVLIDWDYDPAEPDYPRNERDNSHDYDPNSPPDTL